MGRAITRREALGGMAAGVLGTAAASLPGCGGLGPPRRPNVLFIFDDQLRADVCGVYGGRYITTPNIDRLAGEGVVFTNSVSSCPLCTPFRGMVQTGRYPTHSGIVMNFLEASHAQNPNCLADVFAAAGYRTGFIGKWHLSSGWHHEEGIYGADPGAIAAYQSANPETEFVAPGPGRLGYQHWQAYNFHLDYKNYYFYEDEPRKLYAGTWETDTEFGQAIAYMETCRQARQPFLLTVAPHPPHPPYSTNLVPDGYMDLVLDSHLASPNIPDGYGNDVETQCYLAMTKNVDTNLGRVLAYLDQSGLAQDTIVVFTSDHGEMFGSHGRFGKMVPYAEAMNIPLVMRWPHRIGAGLRVDALHTPMDHLPTLCGLAGLAIPREIDGADLSQVVLGDGKDGREEVLIGNYSSSADYFQTGTDFPEWRGVKTKQHTYFRWLAGKEELYDNLEDPYQMHDLAADGSRREVQARLRGRLAELLGAAHDDFAPGTAYGEWYDKERNLVRTGFGPVPG
jgi:arylsulfatase A-like enzyme